MAGIAQKNQSTAHDFTIGITILGCVRKVVSFARPFSSTTYTVSCCLPIVPHLKTGERYKSFEGMSKLFCENPMWFKFQISWTKEEIIHTKTQNDKIFTGKK